MNEGIDKEQDRDSKRPVSVFLEREIIADARELHINISSLGRQLITDRVLEMKARFQAKVGVTTCANCGKKSAKLNRGTDASGGEFFVCSEDCYLACLVERSDDLKGGMRNE